MFGASSAARGQRRPYTAANGPAGYHNVQGTPSPMAHSSRRTYTSPDKGIAGANTLDDDQLREIQDTFELFDQDKDGYLTYFELKVAMRALGFDVPKTEVLQILHAHSRPGSNLISRDDFIRLMQEKIMARDPTDEIRRAFSLFDQEGSGVIRFEDLKRVAQHLGEDIDDNELKAMIDEFDLDNDGAINEQEFITIMTMNNS